MHRRAEAPITTAGLMDFLMCNYTSKLVLRTPRNDERNLPDGQISKILSSPSAKNIPSFL
jgi:hypothetical protein